MVAQIMIKKVLWWIVKILTGGKLSFPLNLMSKKIIVNGSKMPD